MKSTKAIRYFLFFAIVVLIISFLMVYVQRDTLNTYNRNLPFIALEDRIKNDIGQARFRMEEIMAGDRTLNFEKDVIGLFKVSGEILQAAYDGRNSNLGSFQRPMDEETKVILKEAIIAIENLTTAAIDRWQASNHFPSGRDSSLVKANAEDGGLAQRFDPAFQKFQISMDRLGSHVTKQVHTDAAYLSNQSWVTGLVVFTTFACLCFIVYKVQSGNERIVMEKNNQLQSESNRVGTLTQFIEAVSAGNYNIELKTTAQDDYVTATLMKMRDTLRETADADRKRNWSTSGLAQIGEILRMQTASPSDLYDNIIKFVVKYTGSNQGGMFIINEETENNPYLELVACYAYERKKYLSRQIEIGDGIVGQCYLEGEKIYLQELPEEYVNITSGLGGATPNALLVVPMKVNNKVYGVIELASFQKFQEYEIELVEKLAESIAATISNVRVNETTRTLLEKTQHQAEQMRSQEEEIRQNMEELEATQEEMKRKQTILEFELLQSREQAEKLAKHEKKIVESQEILQSIIDHIPRAIFWKDKDLNFMGCNRIFASVAGLSSPSDVVGKSDFDMAWRAHANAYREDDLEVIRKRSAKLDIEEVNVNNEGKESCVLTSKVPIINKDSDVVAILGMFEDITDRKNGEAIIAGKMQEREEALKELRALKQLLETRKT